MLWVDEVATIAIVEFWDIVAVFFFEVGFILARLYTLSPG